MTGIAWLRGFSADLAAEATRFEPELSLSQSREFARWTCAAGISGFPHPANFHCCRHAPLRADQL